jgi:hypothetical protein
LWLWRTALQCARLLLEAGYRANQMVQAIAEHTQLAAQLDIHSDFSR